MSMRILILASCLLVQASAQSSDLLNVLASEAYSLFTSAASIFEDQSTSTSATVTSDTSTHRTTSFATSTSTSADRRSDTPSQASSLSSSQTFRTSLITSSSTTDVLAASSSTPPTSTTSNNNHDRTLAIALGTVLGALALGLFILLMFVLFRHRRRSQVAGSPKGYVSAASEDLLDSNKSGPANVRKANVFLPSRRFKSLRRRDEADPPLMSEHTIHDVPAPPLVRDDRHVPFRSRHGKAALVHSSTSNSQRGKSVHQDQLQNEESSRSLLAPGHSRSESNPKPYIQSNVVEIHPAFRNGTADQPSTQPSNQTSMQPSTQPSDEPATRPSAQPPTQTPTHSSSRASNKVAKPPKAVRINFYAPGNYVTSPLRNEFDPDSADIPVIAMASGSGQSDTRYKPAYRDPPFNEGSGGVREMSAMPTPPAGQINDNPLDANTQFVMITSTASRSNSGMDSEARSHKRSQPSLTPIISIPKPKSSRQPNLPTRSPKRTRFSNTPTYHEPSPLYNQNFSNGEEFLSVDQPSSAYPSSIASFGTVEFVSPISPQEGNGGYRRHMPVATGKANLVDVPGARDVNYNSLSTQTPISPETSQPYPQRFYGTVLNNDNPQSALLSGAGSRFYQPPPPQPQTPMQTSPQQSRKPAFPHFIKSTFNNSKGITRKPVPQSTYSRITTIDEDATTRTQPTYKSLLYEPPNMYNTNTNTKNNNTRRSGEYPSWPERYDGSDDL